MTILITGCSVISPQKNRPDSYGQEEHARNCYKLGISYMENSRYELARQQFTFAAASTVSKPLYLKAIQGIRRVDQIIDRKR
ncbi:MAG: hypothetical protein R6V20_07035 [Desulfobia sp.]